jgi:phage tail-like protein
VALRTELAGLPSPHPIGERLPAVYAEDTFVQNFTAALDEVLAPVFVTLDCFSSYLDPGLAPADFIDWLATWVALQVDEDWSQARRRELVANAVELHRWRGTCRGLAAHVRLLTGGDVQVIDSGRCAASNQPDAPLPGNPVPRVQIRVRVPDPTAVDRPLLLAAIADAVPAHVRVDLEIVGW